MRPPADVGRAVGCSDWWVYACARDRSGASNASVAWNGPQGFGRKQYLLVITGTMPSELASGVLSGAEQFRPRLLRGACQQLVRFGTPFDRAARHGSVDRPPRARQSAATVFSPGRPACRAGATLALSQAAPIAATPAAKLNCRGNRPTLSAGSAITLRIRL